MRQNDKLIRKVWIVKITTFRTFAITKLQICNEICGLHFRGSDRRPERQIFPFYFFSEENLISLREGKILSAQFKSLPEQRDGVESGFSLTQTDYQPNWNISNFKFKKKLQIDFIEISWLSRLMDIPFIFRGPDFWHPQSIG